MQTRLQRGDPLAAAADLLVVTVAEPGAALPPAAAAADRALGGAVARALADREVRPRAGTLALFHAGAGAAAPRVAVVGTGAGDAEGWRAAGRAAGARARALGARAVALGADDAGAEQVGAFVGGFSAGAYRFGRFRTRDEDATPPPEHLLVCGGAARAADLRRADRLAAAVTATRELGDTPSNHMTPTLLADHARALADAEGRLECTVLGPDELRELGAGALLAVSRGSAEPPALIVLRHRPARPRRSAGVLGLVGKAVTFDTGGISIKPSAGMEEMKLDMAGGAAVIEATALLAALRVPVEVVAVVPATENMPGGRATKPGDVVTTLGGRTVEITNTDAEGRLILADGLSYAVGAGATRLLDLATLTGAMVVALGDVYAGLFGSDPDWTEAVRAGGEASGDLVWPMPMHERYGHLIKSKVADLANSSGKRQAGAVYAAQFLREFTDGTPWCHLDIAGTADADGRGTGFGVGLILAAAEALARARGA